MHGIMDHFPACFGPVVYPLGHHYGAGGLGFFPHRCGERLYIAVKNTRIRLQLLGLYLAGQECFEVVGVKQGQRS